MVGALGAEVDRLETEIQQLMPGIRHIDLVCTPCHVTLHGAGSLAGCLAHRMSPLLVKQATLRLSCPCTGTGQHLSLCTAQFRD